MEIPYRRRVLAGDLFSSEDRHGTWKTILTRSLPREDVFAGKLLAVCTLVLALMLILAVMSLIAGIALRRTARAREPERSPLRRRGGCSR